MCGLTGYLCLDGGLADRQAAALGGMADQLTHRGPDAHGKWVDGPIALGHRRLSILDTSDAGLQPMTSRCGRFVLIYNGEIYNFTDLRDRILAPTGITPRSGTDTEILLEVIAKLGPAAALPLLNGMFAFALWDRRDRELHLARDRVGIKPLYWARRGNTLLFGSQIRSFTAHPDWTNAFSKPGLWDFFNHTNIGQDRTAYENCWKVEPGQHLVIAADGTVVKRRFHDLTALANTRPVSNTHPRSYDDAVEELDTILQQVILDQSRADVPLGAFLSGGIDSSSVVAALRQSRPVHTYSIGYEEGEFDESQDARAIAEHLGTEHSEFILRPDDAVAMVPQLASMFDEPFADPSQIPTAIISKLARKTVKVALSGDGGDELFAGYERYELSTQAWRHVERIPAMARKPVSCAISSVPPPVWKTLLRPFLSDAGKSMPYFARLLRDPSVNAYHHRVNYLGIGGTCMLDNDHGQSVDASLRSPPLLQSSLDALLHGDQTRRLPDSMLTKVDRASMASSLEIRVPLLDNRILDFAWSVPQSFLIREGRRKAVLRDVLKRYVPQHLFDRPKKGFHIPLTLWLGGPLRDWAESLLSDRLGAVTEFLDPATARDMWNRYLAGDRHLTHPIWVILMFLAWHETQRLTPQTQARHAF